MPAPVFLDRQFDAERSGQEERRIQKMLKNIGLAIHPAIERARIKTLAAGAWITNAEVVLMPVPPGIARPYGASGARPIAGSTRKHSKSALDATRNARADRIQA